MVVTYKNEEDPIKNEGARGFTTYYTDFSDAQGQLTVVSVWIWPKFKLYQAFMHVLVTCKNEEDPINKSCRMTA